MAASAADAAAGPDEELRRQQEDVDRADMADYEAMFEQFPQIGELVSVARAEGEGKFMVAKRDLKEVGEIFLFENAFVRWSNVSQPGNEDFMEPFPNLPWERWLEWQRQTSPKAGIGLVALVNCLCHISTKVNNGGDFDEVLRPFQRLCGVPKPHGKLVFHGTTIEELAEIIKRDCEDQAPFATFKQRDLCFSVAFLEELAGRLSQNSIAYGENSEFLVFGVFVLLSLCNHDCNPNVEVEACADGRGVGLRLLREVSAGEKLTISYCPNLEDLEERRRRLGHWFFDCSCARCCAEPLLLRELATMPKAPAVAQEEEGQSAAKRSRLE